MAQEQAVAAPLEKPPTLAELIKKAADLNMMPQVARKVIDLVANENSTASQLAEVLEKDPNITARILKISNSAFYGLRREVKTIQQAIVVLGFKSLRSLVVASSSKSLHKRFGITEQLMWDHSIGTAIAAKIVSEGFPSAVGENAFVGGLLHNVGKTIMNNEVPKAYVEVMKRVYNNHIACLDAEEAVFGYGHPEVGFLISERWGLPADLGNLIRYYNLAKLTPEQKMELFSNQVLKLGLACVEMGSNICEVLGLGFREKNKDLDLTQLESAKILQADKTKIEGWLKRVNEAYLKERALFN